MDKYSVKDFDEYGYCYDIDHYLSNQCYVNSYRVYHYTSPNSLLSILCGDPDKVNTAKLWFTRFDSLNDRNEQREILDFFNGYCQVKIKDGAIPQKFADSISAIQLHTNKLITIETKEETIDLPDMGGIKCQSTASFEECDVYLCCFSLEDDLLPMWNYYSKSNRYEGYCIGFCYSAFTQTGAFNLGYYCDIHRVIYDDAEKTALFDRFLLPLLTDYGKYTQAEDALIMKYVNHFLSEFQFLFKNRAFTHEKEARAILYIPKRKIENVEGFPIKYRNSNGYIVPYIEYVCPPYSVSSVRVAPLLEKELAVKNLTEYLENNNYRHVSVLPSEIPIRF